MVEMANESDSEMTGALPTPSGAKNPPSAPGLGASKYASLDNLVRDKPAQAKEPAPKPQAKPAKTNGIPLLLDDADAVREQIETAEISKWTVVRDIVAALDKVFQGYTIPGRIG